jgi:hypothetical protein
MMQNELIDGSNWRVLIILDACRYDYFKEFYKDYFRGTLYKVLSSGSCTSEWCKKTFTKYYEDVIYVSSNPYINSMQEIAGFPAKKFFSEIIDVWKFGWNKQLGTVHPGALTQISLNLFEKYPEKRFIIHYLQPHSPYLGALQSPGYPIPILEKPIIMTGLSEEKDYRSITVNKFSKLLEWSFRILRIGNINVNKIFEILRLPPRDPMDYFIREFGISLLKEAYKQNLILVFKSLLKLTSGLSGTVVISSDHGELLGEDNMIGHPDRYNHSLLLEIPWFEIDCS